MTRFAALNTKLERLHDKKPLLAHVIAGALGFFLTVIACSLLILLDSIARGVSR